MALCVSATPLLLTSRMPHELAPAPVAFALVTVRPSMVNPLTELPEIAFAPPMIFVTAVVDRSRTQLASKPP